jgi:peptidylprolyl isomerase
MNKIIISFFAILMSVTAFGATDSQKMENKSTCCTSEDNVKVKLTTTMGDITLLLYNDTPLHRDNFVKLVKEGFYDGLLFHRVISDFMIQGGDPDSKNAEPGKSLGSGEPGYTIPAEFVYPKHYHKYGSLAAARTPDQMNPERRSSGSQFYIVVGRKLPESQLERNQQRLNNDRLQAYFGKLVEAHASEIEALQKSGDKDGLEALRQQFIKETESNVETVQLSDEMKETYMTLGGTPHLDDQYTVFGEVVEGMETVEKIQKVETDRNDRPVEDVKIISAKILK